jgi:BetI-type transcriptional repressor, C-terminal
VPDTLTVRQRGRAADVRAREPLQQLIRAGITAGQWLPDADPGLQARLILATLHGLMAQWHLAPGSFSWTEAATAIAADPSTP